MNKEIIIKTILVIVYTVFIIMFISEWTSVENTSYKVTKVGCNSAKKSSKELTEEGECKNPGYYIDNDRVNISLGKINCTNDIEIQKIEVDEEMNIYIKIKEKIGKNQVKCVCNPSINIQFNEEVNNVTLVTEDGTELDECK